MTTRTTTAASLLVLFLSAHAALMAVAADDRQPSFTESAPQAGPSLAGTWIGVYQIYPTYVQMTLTIAGEPSASGEASAEMRVEGLEGRNARNMGVSQATVRYQADVRAIDISAEGRSPISGLRLHAVYDADRRVFAGYRVNASTDASPYFLMVRRGEERKLFDRIKDMPDGALPRGGLSIGGSAPSADVLRKWASQIFRDYPDIDPYRTESGALYLMARNLFRDEYFEPFFGKTYDELSNRDLTRINGRLEDLPPPRSNFPEERANGAARPLARGFWVNVGTFAAPDIMLSVVATRSIAAWKRQMLQGLDGIAPSAGTFDTLNRIEAEESGVLGTFWPSERKAVLDALDGHRARLAGPVLLARVNQQVAAATRFEDVSELQRTLSMLARPSSAPVATPNPRAAAAQRRPSFAVPVARAGTTADIGSLVSMAGETARADLRNVVERKISTLVAAEADRDRARLAVPPTGSAMSRLEAGGALYRQLQTKYASVATDPTVASLFAELSRQRVAVLSGAQAELDLTIAKAPSESALDDVLSRFLNVPSDRSDAVGGRLMAAADTKKQAIRLAQQQAAAARQQAAAMKERMAAARTADVAARRRALIAEYGVHLPTIEDLYNALTVVPLIAERTSASDEAQFLGTIRRLGFTLRHPRGELFSDINNFTNNRGHELTTFRSQDSSGKLFFVVTLTFPDPAPALMELYAAELRAEYREMRRSTPDLSEGAIKIATRSPPFVKSGSTTYDYEVADGQFKVTAMSNFDATAAVMAERLDQNTLRVNSYSRTTDVDLARGQRIHLRVSGRVTLGPFVGSTGPNGVEGYPNFRFVSSFPLGSLIGRFDQGEWFLVGAERTITAPEGGTLILKINDNDVGNNDGTFDVAYTIDSPNR